MTYQEQLEFLRRNRDTSARSGPEAFAVMDAFQEFCAAWQERAVPEQIPDLMGLFHNNAPIQQNEFVHYLIDGIVERFPAAAIPQVVRSLASLGDTDGDECAFYPALSICRRPEYAPICTEALGAASPNRRAAVLAELRRLDTPAAREVLAAFPKDP